APTAVAAIACVALVRRCTSIRQFETICFSSPEALGHTPNISRNQPFNSESMSMRRFERYFSVSI
ncbi:TPA: hypothetical protein ACKFH8_004479, partial [Burkholderia multivorans]